MARVVGKKKRKDRRREIEVPTASGVDVSGLLGFTPVGGDTFWNVVQALKEEHQRLYLDHQEREEDLQDDSEGIRGMRQARETKVTMSVLVEVADMQAVVPKLVKEAAEVLGDGQEGDGDNQFNGPVAAAWVPSQPDWQMKLLSQMI